MSKPTAAPTKAGMSEAAGPKPRSKARLALLVAAPLLALGGAGFAAWHFGLVPGMGAAEAAAGEGGADHAAGPAPDPVQVAALPIDVLAETSFTHSLALATLMTPTCGKFRTEALKGASDEEARADGMLVSLSWAAAARRAAGFTDRSCGMVVGEIVHAEAKAARIAAERARAAGEGTEASAGHH